MISKFFNNKVHYFIDSPVKNLRSTEFEVNKWELSDFILKVLIKQVGVNPYQLDELMLMTASVCRCHPTHIFEWGTHIGKSARIFYEICKYFKINSEIHSFDLPDNIDHIEHPHEKRGFLVRNLKEVKLYQEDGLKKGIDIFNSSSTENKQALFYLDGDHSFDTVCEELSVISNNIVNPIFLLHDTFYQSLDSGYNIGPYSAMSKFLSENKDYKVISTSLGLPGMSLLYKNL